MIFFLFRFKAVTAKLWAKPIESLVIIMVDCDLIEIPGK